jgi:phosphatidate phosphatase APP1
MRILLLLLLLPFQVHAQKIALISGFDDVVRQAENQSLVRSGLKLFSKDHTFTGMPELYSSLLKDNGLSEFFLVSGTSSLFKGRIQKFISGAGYPACELHLRNWIKEWSVEEFKAASIQKILDQHESPNLIVIFDNSGASLQMVKTFPQAFPGKLLQMYLRETVQMSEPAGAHLFVTAFDLAVMEYQAQRLSEASVSLVGETILANSDAEKLIPAYAYCPAVYDPCAAITNVSLQSVCARVKARVLQVCESRQNH